MRLLAVIAGLCGLALWLTAAPAGARTSAVHDTVSAAHCTHQHKHRDGGNEPAEETEEDLQAW